MLRANCHRRLAGQGDRRTTVTLGPLLLVLIHSGPERVDQCVVGEGSGDVCPVPQSTLIREIKLTLSFFEPCSPTQPSKVPTFTYPS